MNACMPLDELDSTPNQLRAQTLGPMLPTFTLVFIATEIDSLSPTSTRDSVRVWLQCLLLQLSLKFLSVFSTSWKCVRRVWRVLLMPYHGRLDAAKTNTRSSERANPSICTRSSVFIRRLPSCSPLQRQGDRRPSLTEPLPSWREWHSQQCPVAEKQAPFWQQINGHFRCFISTLKSYEKVNNTYSDDI